MCYVAAIPWAIAAVSAIDQHQNAENAQASSKQAAVDMKNNALKTEASADQANNKANARQANVTGLADANAMDAKGGQSGTMLTGAQGIDPNSLLLGKKTLLGA